MARIRTEEEKEAARQAAKQAKKDQWLREQEEKRPTHEKYMKDAIRQAKKAAALGEVPIGCVIVHDGQVIGRGSVSYTHLRAHETDSYLVCRLLLEKKKRNKPQ